MSVEVGEEPASALEDYARVPIAFEVRRVLDVEVPERGLGGILLVERALDRPYVKDYDAIPGGHPLQWGGRFDLSSWAFFSARVEGRRVGGAAVALNSAGLDPLEGGSELAVLWDLRVSPEARGRGVGTALFRAMEARALASGCRRLKVETQSVNVPACRFYARQGCALGAVHRFAYPALPDEVQLLWYKRLSR